MGRYAQLVIGPAGSGKSTYCSTIKEHCDTVGRSVHVANLDPAAEHFNYPVAFDVRELVTLDDVMDEMDLGPNGGLMACMEYLEEELDDWLADQLQGYGEDDYLLLDCPGQIELYSHSSVFRSLVKYLQNNGWSVCVVYCLDSQFVTDTPKFIAGCLQVLAAMAQLEAPHVSVLTKVDLIQDKSGLEELLVPDLGDLMSTLSAQTGPRFRRLNKAMAGLLDDYSMIGFSALDVSDEESIGEVLMQVDNSIQYSEDADVKVREFGDFEDPED